MYLFSIFDVVFYLKFLGAPVLVFLQNDLYFMTCMELFEACIIESYDNNN